MMFYCYELHKKHPAFVRGGCDFVIVFCKFDKIFSNNRIIAKQH